MRGAHFMYVNSAYLNNSLIDFMDKSKPLIVGSCGTYHLFTHPRLPTYRPKGRLDFQILYIASGKAHFYFNDDGTDTVVNAGNIVVYRPKEPQKYEYFGIDQTEVYWVHFTGSDIKNMLRSYGITDNMHVINTRTSLEYTRIFKQMILELQRHQSNYPEMLALLLRQLLILIHRQLTTENKIKNVYLDTEMEKAIQYFNDNYNTEINIEAYAASRGMSVGWFIRCFKQYTGTTPMRYIVSLRITNAQVLLETTDYNVTEIGNIVGYDNPLYFSRIFKKQKGVSPSEYRAQLKTGNSHTY
jgi:AraC family transcriptional regulator of arabinose operon